LNATWYKAPAGEIVSAEKNIEKWNDLWSQWEGVVSEIGDEEGKYVSQDEHWEPPDFDGSAVAEDLEAIAVKLLPLIEEIKYMPLERKIRTYFYRPQKISSTT